MVVAMIVAVMPLAGAAAAETNYPDQTLSGGALDSGHFDDVYDLLTDGDITLSFTYDGNGLIDEFNDALSFQGLSVLVGMTIDEIFNNSPSKNKKISRFHLEKLTKELNLIYCFEIYNNNSDVTEIYNKLLDDFAFRFQYSSPDLFEQAKSYGKHLLG